MATERKNAKGNKARERCGSEVNGALKKKNTTCDPGPEGCA